MSFEIIITDSLNKNKWDDFVANNPKSSIFQTSEMFEFQKNNKKNYPHFIAAVDNTNEILATLLLVHVNEISNSLAFLTAHTSIRGGPIYLNNEAGKEAVFQLLNYYEEKYGKKTLYTKFYNLQDMSQLMPIFENFGYSYETFYSILLDLNKPPDEIFKSMHRMKKQAIKKAIKEGVIIEEINEKELIPVFFDIISATYKRKNILPRSIDQFNLIFEQLVPKKMAKFTLAKFGNKYIAGRLALIYNGLIYDWYGGSLEGFNNLRPNELIIWNVMKWGSENGFHTYDFGGTYEDQPGLLEFKMRFGAKLYNYGAYSKMFKPRQMKISEKLYHVYKSIQKIR